MTVTESRSWLVAPLAIFATCVLLLASDPLAAQSFRSVDGSGNNIANPAWGAADEPLLRLAPPAYGDSISTPAGATRPSARAVSNSVGAQSGVTINNAFASDMLWLWGQFLDHDIDLTETHDRGAEPGEIFDIVVPTGDFFFDPMGTGVMVIELTRSLDVPGSSPRQQPNLITSYIDASNVYGSDSARALELRTNDGSGKLNTSPGDLLPFNINGFPNAGGPSPTLFLAGDVRANENGALSAMHTLWVREHNRLCDEIAAANPGMSGQDIYLRARRLVGALMQKITYDDFLPILLGTAIPPYAGYDALVDAGIANEFSTAAYRFGHTMLSPTLLRYGSNGSEHPSGNLPLLAAFFNPTNITMGGGIDPFLSGIVAEHAQAIDTQVVDDVRNFLFGPPGSGGFDLASLNIQRGRDHGLPNYNALRTALGLSTMTSFTQITGDVGMQNTLSTMYGDINDIDAWVGGLAEDAAPGSLLGELFTTILADQFARLRDGDRFYYENDLTGAELLDVQSTTLADVMARNTSLTRLPADVFVVSSMRRGDFNQDGNLNIADPISMLSWLFSNGNPMYCLDACDINDDGAADLGDAIGMLTYFFTGGAAPQAPFLSCGQDTTEDELGCYSFDPAACP